MPPRPRGRFAVRVALASGLVQAPICVTCGTQFPPAERSPERCPICEDERQYVGPDGQRWTNAEELLGNHHNQIREVEPGLTGIGVEPSFGIGQRGLLVEGEQLLWDCVSLLDRNVVSIVEARGGIGTIAISHPHFYAAMINWAERFDARVLLHEADREWIMRPSPRVECWSGERLELSPGLELIRLGGHFPGGTVALWRGGADGRGALLCGDIVQVVEDRDWASFMWSYPNLIPLPGREVARIRAVLAGLEFDRVYGGWWERVIDRDGHTKVLRSADRYLKALA